MRKSKNTCRYCGSPATTKDHVIARCLLERPFPNKVILPTIPSCQVCNNKYSLDEEYFLAALAMCGFTPKLLSKVGEGGVVDRTLARDKKLDDKFNKSLSVSNGHIYLRPDMEIIGRVITKIVFGLYVYRYPTSKFPKISDFEIMFLSHTSQEAAGKILAMTHNEKFQQRRWCHIQRDVFSFMFVRNWLWQDFGRLVCILKMHETLLATVKCVFRTKSAGIPPANRPPFRRQTGHHSAEIGHPPV